MLASEELFYLIKSMSKSERRYFNIYSSMHVLGEKNNYMKLYEFIANQKNYDKNALKKTFSNESFIKHLPVVKNYLHQLILKSMRAFNDGASVDITLRNYLADIEFLYGKALYKSCRKILKKAKQLAAVHDKFEMLSEILRWEIRIFYHDKGFVGGRSLSKIRKYQTELTNITKQYNNRIEYEIASKDIIEMYFKDGEFRNKKDKKILEKIMRKKLYSNDKYPLSYPAKIRFYEDNGIYNSMIGDKQKTYMFRKKQLLLMEAHPEKFKEQAFSYLVALNNVLVQAPQLKSYKEVGIIIKKMRNIPNLIPSADTEHLRMNIFNYSYTAEIHACILTGQFENIPRIIKEMEAGLQQYNIPVISRHAHYYNIAYVYFILGNYRKALEPLSQILNEDEENTRLVIICVVRIFNLIVHYELNNEELLPYMLKSVSNFLSKRKRMFKVETVLINFFKKKLPAAQNRKETEKVFIELKKELINVMKDPFEANILEYFDLISWVESKIIKSSFIDVLKEKAKQIKQNS
ncbi:MAG: hypothetical protein ACT4ON_01150 [Bacteroidota bacterium]